MGAHAHGAPHSARKSLVNAVADGDGVGALRGRRRSRRTGALHLLFGDGDTANRHPATDPHSGGPGTTERSDVVTQEGGMDNRVAVVSGSDSLVGSTLTTRLNDMGWAVATVDDSAAPSHPAASMRITGE